MGVTHDIAPPNYKTRILPTREESDRYYTRMTREESDRYYTRILHTREESWYGRMIIERTVS